jgi:hypothetical protein
MADVAAQGHVSPSASAVGPPPMPVRTSTDSLVVAPSTPRHRTLSGGSVGQGPAPVRRRSALPFSLDGGSSEDAFPLDPVPEDSHGQRVRWKSVINVSKTLVRMESTLMHKRRMLRQTLVNDKVCVCVCE